jgi:hypothetical protein
VCSKLFGHAERQPAATLSAAFWLLLVSMQHIISYPKVPQFRTVPCGDGDADIQVMVKDQWVTMFLVRDSHMLAQLRQAPSTRKGLYAAVGLPKGLRIGRYVGEVLGRHKDGVAQASRSDALLVLGTEGNFVVDGRRPLQGNQEQRQHFGCVALDADRFPWPGMHAHMMNDPHGTRQRPNVCVTAGGFVETLLAESCSGVMASITTSDCA